MAKKESYYKILGTTANIGNDRIKEKYIAALKKHPPETDPEGFEKVREAYETLRDPAKRMQYDLTRKHGASKEFLMKSARKAISLRETAKAKELLIRANEAYPGDPNILTALMTLAIELGDFQKADEFFEDALRAIPEAQTSEMVEVYNLRAIILLEYEKHDLALETIEKGINHFPDEKDSFAAVLVRYHVEVGQF